MIDDVIIRLDQGETITNKSGTCFMNYIGYEENGKKVYELYSLDRDREIGRTTDKRLVRSWLNE